MTCLRQNEEIDQKTTGTLIALLQSALRVIRDARFTVSGDSSPFSILQSSWHGRSFQREDAITLHCRRKKLMISHLAYPEFVFFVIAIFAIVS